MQLMKNPKHNQIEELPELSPLQELLGLLIAAYPKTELPAMTLQVYEASLMDLPIDKLRKVIFCHISESPFFPEVAVLRAGVAEMVEMEKMFERDQRASIAADCRLCDSNGFRYLELPDFKGTRKCTHNPTIEAKYQSVVQSQNLNSSSDETLSEEDYRKQVLEMTSKLKDLLGSPVQNLRVEEAPEGE